MQCYNTSAVVREAGENLFLPHTTLIRRTFFPFMFRIFLLLSWLLCCCFPASAQAEASPICRVTKELDKLALQACSAEVSVQDLPTHLSTERERQQGQWVRLRLSALPMNTVLDIGIPDAYWIEVVSFEANTSVAKRVLRLNEQSSFHERPVLHRNLLLHLDASESSRDVYIHYQTHVKTPLQMHLYSERSFAQHDAIANLLNGLIFGLMLIVVPLVILVFRSVHNSNYRIYAGLVLANLAFLAQVDGYGFQFLWPESPQWNMKMPGIFALIVPLWHIVFAIRFLQMRVRMLKLYLWHIGFFWLVAFVLILQITIGVDEIALPVALSYSILALIAALRGVQIGVPAATFYLIGNSIEIFFVVFMLGVSITFTNPFPFISVLDYPKLGYIGEAVFFAAAVWSQIRLFNERQAEQRVRRLAETEQLLKAERDKIEALEKAKQQQLQLASASHDIAQPLAALRFAAAALGQKAENRAVAEHLEQTLSYAQSMLRDMISRSKEEHVTTDEEVDVHQLLQQLTREFEATARQKGLRLNIHDCSLKFTGSSLLLYRILSNLVSNALRYTSKGRVVVGVRRKADTIVFQVWDTGPGIYPQQLQLLLRAFERGEHAAQAAEGFGLGLYIVSSLCRQCDYRLSIDSEPGKGSVFSLHIPKQKI